jgi:hypothetical protein
VLTVNHCLELLQRRGCGESWESAFENTLPVRKDVVIKKNKGEDSNAEQADDSVMSKNNEDGDQNEDGDEGDENGDEGNGDEAEDNDEAGDGAGQDNGEGTADAADGDNNKYVSHSRYRPRQNKNRRLANGQFDHTFSRDLRFL